MITNLEYLKTAVLMLDQGGLTPGEELRILEGVANVITLNKDRIEYEILARVDKVLADIKGE